MSEIIQGDGTQANPVVDQGIRTAISATTNAAPIKVTTSGAHNYFTGNTVQLEGTGLIDGAYIVTVVDGTNFTLNGSAAPGATVHSGYCINFSVTPAFQVPTPGDLASAVTLIPVLQGLMNWMPSSYSLAGKYRIYNYYAGLLKASPGTNADPYSSSWSANATFSAGNNFIPLSGVSLDQLLNGGAGSAAGPVVVNGEDILDVEYQFSAQLVAGTAVNVTFHVAAFPGLQANFRGISATTAATPVQVTTTAAHGLSSGDFAGIFGMGIASLNNLWQITRIDNFNYTLNGSTNPGVTGSGGTAVSIPFADITVMTPSNWPLIGVTTAGTIQPYSVRSVLGGALIPGSNSPFTPSALYWFGLYVTPVTAANLSQVNLIGPAMCRVWHLRIN